MLRQELNDTLSEVRSEFERVSDAIWGYAELGFKEVKSAKEQADLLEKKGFSIKMQAAGMPSAFIAERGEGLPVIAFIGELDALPGLSQEADIPMEKPIEKGGSGHGCGHNLLGTGAAEAALLTSEYLKKHNMKGTVRYYGCPAEEIGGGKVFMTLEGCFDDVDFAFSWHPYHYWDITTKGRAIVSAYFRFYGVAAHALHAEQGRNAFDALELMIQGFNMLRKSVKADTAMSYGVTCAGSKAANVVSDYAEGLFQLRHYDPDYLKELFGRVVDLARGAAIMTGTKFDKPIIAGNYANYMVNETLNSVVFKNMQEALPITYTEEELEYGNSFLKVGAENNAKQPFRSDICIGNEVIHSDVCDVSWQVPLAHFFGVTLADGTKPHNWGTVAQGKSSTAKKGMHTSALILANSALDIIEDKEIMEKAQQEFVRRKADKQYSTLLTKDDLKLFI